jgi:hypothetical protein
MIIYITQWGRVVTRNWQHDRLTVEKLAADCLDVRNRCLELADWARRAKIYYTCCANQSRTTPLGN